MADTTTNPFALLNVNPVINAAGKMTALGGSAQQAEVADALSGAARAHVDLAALRRAAGSYVASRCGAAAGSVTTGAAAGLCISVAAVLTGSNRDRVTALPLLLDGPREVILQAGHNINFGADVEQMIRLGGGQPVVAGSDAAVTGQDVRNLITADTACLVFVISHHCLQDHRLNLRSMINLAHESNLPIIVDAAAEQDLGSYVAAGADLVTYSGGKALGGPTCGFIVGAAELVDACELQQHGIARTMKVGKEQIMGLIAALKRYPGKRSWPVALDALMHALAPLPGIQVTRVADRAGRDIERAGVSAVDTNIDLNALVRYLRDGNPPIYTRNHQLNEGLLLFDPRELTLDQVPVIASRVAAYCANPGAADHP